MVFVSIKNLKHVARTRLLRCFNGESDDTALLPMFRLKIRSFRMLDSIVCSGRFGLAVLSGLGRLETHPGIRLDLPFRGH
jgi:hypothetical protein